MGIEAGGRNFQACLLARLNEVGQQRILMEIGGDGVLPAIPRKGVGLQGIHDRALSLGERLRLSSDPRGMRMLVLLKFPTR